MDDARYTVRWTDSRDGTTHSDGPLEPQSAAELVTELERVPALTEIHLIPAGHPPLSDSADDATRAQLNVEKAQLLWEEYHYRHDLIWRLLFRMTFVAVLVSTVPFTNDDLDGEVRKWVETLPALAIAFVAIGWIVLVFEFRLFKPINDKYVEIQKNVVGQVRTPGPDIFALVVYVYPGVLLALLALVAAASWSS